MPKEAVVGIVKYNGSILLVRKIPGKDFLSGEWHIPGETKEGWESDEEALKRGIREETGIEISVEESIGSYKSPNKREVRWYLCTALSYRLNPGSDVDAAEWVPYEQVHYRHSEKTASILPERIKKHLGYQ